MSSFDYGRFRWRRDAQVPNRLKREAGGGELIEDVWNVYNYGEQNLFVGIYTSFAISIDNDALLSVARKAWISLRWDVPTVAATSLHEPNDPLPTPYIIYDLPGSYDSVAKWSEETVLLQTGYKDLDDLRYHVGQDPLPASDLEPQTFLYILPISSDNYGFLFRTSHVTFDGAGIKVLATKFLEHLACYLTSDDYERLELGRHLWGQEESNILPCPTEVLRNGELTETDNKESSNKGIFAFPKEYSCGPPYEQTLAEVVKDLANGRPLAHPFKTSIREDYDPSKCPPKTRRASFKFSLEESEKIIASGLANTGESGRLSVNQLAHGALCLLPVFDNPPNQDSNRIVFFYGIADTRRRMIKKYRGPLDYPGYCIGMSPIQVPVAKIMELLEDYKDDHKHLVIEMAKIIQKEYRRQAAYPSLLAIHYELIDELLKLPPPPRWCGPSFSGDGKGGTYLRQKFPENGHTAIEVTDFFLGLNKTDPAPFFRVKEWSGRIMLSADYNEMAVDPAVVDTWMKQWADLLLAVTL